jgi:outer membrane receptor protein involved in Fe transport
VLLATWSWGERARADAPTDAPATPAPPDVAKQSNAEPTPPRDVTKQSNTEPTPPTWSDADLLKMAEQGQGETIEIYDERPDKPFDRDTEVRLTGEQLAARGAVDLGSALALLPDVTVRDAGRGGFNIDIRGGRKGEVAILIDGVLVTDPYYGTFDVSTIPITDIVQIRISTTSSSPIDGPGGPGGIVEVHTRDGIGSQLVIARLTGDSLPSFTATGTARVPLTKHLGLRFSASGLDGARDYDLTGGQAALPESRHAATGSARLEYRDGDRRIALDGFLDDRHYVPPPADAATSAFLVIDRETSARVSAKFDDKVGDNVQVQAESWFHYLYRRSRSFEDVTLQQILGQEDLSAYRTGGMALATQPFLKDFRWIASTTVDSETATDTNAAGKGEGTTTVLEPAAGLQFEHGPVRTDAAVGLALPFGAKYSSPWPEFRADVKYKPIQDLQLSITGGRKGRVPSLRERFDPAQGNPTLGPEEINYVEFRAIEQVSDAVRVEVAPFYRYQTGTIRADPNNKGIFDALDKLRIYGTDFIGRVRLHPMVEVGVGYSYIRAKTCPGNDALTLLACRGPNVDVDAMDRLPRNKVEGWVQATPDPRVAVLARVKYFGRNVDGTNPDMSPRYVSGYTLVEGNASWALTKHYLAVLRVDDLLDARPYTRFGFSGPGRVIALILQGTWE